MRLPPLRNPVCHYLVNRQESVLKDDAVLRVGEEILEVKPTREGIFESANERPDLRSRSTNASSYIDEPSSELVLVGICRERHVQEINRDLRASAGGVGIVNPNGPWSIKRKRVMVRGVVVRWKRELELMADAELGQVVV